MPVKNLLIEKLCENLPDPLNPNLDMKELIKASYKVFKAELLNNPDLKFQGRPVTVSEKIDDLYLWEISFEHIITEKHGGSRMFCRTRLAMLSWIRYILVECCKNKCSNLQITNQENRICIECLKTDYRIVIEYRKAKKDFILITAYIARPRMKDSNLDLVSRVFEKEYI